MELYLLVFLLEILTATRTLVGCYGRRKSAVVQTLFASMYMKKALGGFPLMGKLGEQTCRTAE